MGHFVQMVLERENKLQAARNQMLNSRLDSCMEIALKQGVDLAVQSQTGLSESEQYNLKLAYDSVQNVAAFLETCLGDETDPNVRMFLDELIKESYLNNQKLLDDQQLQELDDPAEREIILKSRLHPFQSL